MAKVETRGSWFNSGFHGHFRSKARLDFINEFRQLAKPQPPKTFSKRAQIRANDHVFSKHDNRHSFMDDALYFEQGLGKRRIRNNNNKYQPDLLDWKPFQRNFERPGAKTSVYKLDFRGPVPHGPIKQQITMRPRTSFDDDMPKMTTYRYAHGEDNPNKPILNVMSNSSLNTARAVGKRRSYSAQPVRESVASCMTWHSATPNATKFSDMSQLMGASVPKTAPALMPQTAPATMPAEIQFVPAPPPQPAPVTVAMTE